MSTLLKINVTNAQPNNNNFFFFQKPAVYIGGQQVYSNSLYKRTLGPASGGGEITFMSNLQFYAAVQQTDTATPPVGDDSGYESAIQAIDLAAKNNQPPNHDSAIMSWDSNTQALGLASPTNDPEVQSGAFRITTATYSAPPTFFNAGSATMVNGGVVLSSFVNAQPQTRIDCQPVLQYYVQTGEYRAGTVMNFSESSVDAASCDFTGGYVTANVVYQTNGSWKVVMS